MLIDVPQQHFEIHVVLLLTTMMTLIVLGCNPSQDQANTEAASQNKILPNPKKVYSEQCYVWLKEMPDFFRERHYLADEFHTPSS